MAPTVTKPDAVNTTRGPSQDMIQSWKEEFMQDMKTCWDQFVGDAPPQPTVGPAVPSANMDPNPLWQLSSSDDREASRAQRKARSKRADSGVRQSSRSGERSSADRHRAQVRYYPVVMYDVYHRIGGFGIEKYHSTPWSFEDFIPKQRIT